MNMTRRNFIGALTAAAAVPAVGAAAVPKEKAEDWFQDLLVDRYYAYQGGEYGDTGGWGCPYSGMMDELMSFFKYHDHCRDLEDVAETMEKRGYYLSQSQYFGKPYRRYGNISLTKRWVLEFYRRYKDGEMSGKCYEAIVRAQESIDIAVEKGQAE